MTDEAAPKKWVNPRGSVPAFPGVELRLVDRSRDYPLVCEWWKSHGWPPVPAERLPALGVVAECDGHPAAAAWLYMDNSGSGVAMLEWIVGNPDAPARAVIKCIRAAAEWLMWRAGEDDLRFTFFLATCRQPALARLLERSGFTATDTGVIHLCSQN